MPLEFPATSQQKRLWFMNELFPESVAYNVCAVYDVEGPVDPTIVKAAANVVARRHPALAVSLHATPEGLIQKVDPNPDVDFTMLDWSSLPLESRFSALSRWADQPYDLQSAGLFRVLAAKTGERSHTVAFGFHHAVCDGVSIGIVAREVVSFCGGQEAEPDDSDAYLSWCAEVRAQSALLDDERDFWREYLAGAPHELTFSAVHHPPVQTFRGSFRTLTVPVATAAQASELATAEKTTVFAVLFSALLETLRRHTDETDLLVGVQFANRLQSGLAGTVGFLANTVVVRVKIGGTETFRELVQRVREQLLSVADHSTMPFEALVDEFAHRRQLSRSPLVQVMMSYQSAPDVLVSGDTEWHPRTHSGTQVKCDVDLNLSRSAAGDVRGYLGLSDAFDSEYGSRFAADLIRLLAAGIANPDRPLCQLSTLTLAEANLLAKFSSTRASPVETSISEELHESFLLHRDRVAIGGETNVSYQELGEAVGGAITALRDAGVVAGDRVGICVGRGPDLVVSLIASLYSGVAFVPIDPEYPESRWRHMLAESEAVLIVVDDSTRDIFSGCDLPLVNLASSADATLMPPEIIPDCVDAYVLFTSGSTGQPKGVIVSRANLGAFIRAMRSLLELAADTRLLATTTVTFDIALLELIAPFFVGASIEVVPSVFHVASAAHAPTLVQATPSGWTTILSDSSLSDAISPLKILSGGEPIPGDLAEALCARWPNADVLNMYGPTETTIWSTAGRLQSGNEPSAGFPIDGSEVAIVDERGVCRPIGCVGEIWIGGRGVATGYAGSPRRTADRFRPDRARAGQRVYRTGDLGRLTPGGLQVLGRNDLQVKLRGHRVELGEIEAALRSLPAVVEAAVSVSRRSVNDVRLHAFVVAMSDVTDADLRGACEASLPSYMVPSSYQVVGSLPRTSSGKLDRTKLDQLTELTSAAPQAFPAEEDESFATLADVWASVLGIRPSSATDDFFDLGGHSLLLPALRDGLATATGRSVSLVDLFERPTMRLQIELLVGGKSATAVRVGGRRRAPARDHFEARTRVDRESFSSDG